MWKVPEGERVQRLKQCDVNNEDEDTNPNKSMPVNDNSLSQKFR